MAKPTVVCITGVGHSGSTILGIVLGNHSNIETVGEIHKLHRFGWKPDDSRRCSCGVPLYQCPFWRAVYVCWSAQVGSNGLDEYISLQDSFERAQGAWLRVLAAKHLGSAKFNRYTEMTAALYQSICDVSGKEVIVDTSKSPARSYALLSSGVLELRLIHLVRDGRAIIGSRKRERKRDVDGGIPHDSPSFSARYVTWEWLITNLKSEWVLRQAGAHRARRVLYEHFVQTPGVVLQEIGTLIHLDLTQVGEEFVRGEMMQIGHIAAGNHVRMSGQIKLRPDTGWTHQLPPNDRRIFWLIAGRLAHRYGYSL